MIVFGLLVHTVFIALVQGQGPLNRNPDWRQWVRARNRNAPSVQIHARVHPQQRVEGEEEDGQLREEDLQPMTWRELLVSHNVTNVAGFISLLTRNGQPIQESDLFAPSESQDGKLVISGSGEQMAESDECSVRNMTVRLDVNVSDPSIAYYPECTKLPRCGGCTPTPYLACVPRDRDMITVWVLKANYLYPGAAHMEIEGFVPLEVERHLSCRVECILKPEDCGNDSIFIRNQCRCRCRSVQRCVNDRTWDENTCSCRCWNQGPCCGSEDREGGRRCPLYFDKRFCECTLKESVGASPNASQEEMEAWLASRGRPPFNPSFNGTVAPLFPTPTPTTQPPTTTTTTPATTQEMCSHINCPRGMIRAMTRSGRCLCQRPRRRP